MGNHDEQVDILEPPFFGPSGRVKPREQAHDDGDWIGTFNLWIVTKNPVPSIIYQQRSLNKKWAPGMLDVSAGGHYNAGEKLIDGLREVEEELGKFYKTGDLIRLGRGAAFIVDTNRRLINEIYEVYLTEDNSPLNSYKLQESEVSSLCACPISQLLKVHRDANYSFDCPAIDTKGNQLVIKVTRDIFPKNWDNYHYKMALIADRYFKGDKNLVY